MAHRKKHRLDGATAKLLAPKDRPSDAEDDPLATIRDVTTGSLEGDSAEEIDALAAGFRQRMGQENDRFRRAVDTEHWFAVCFVDRDHKEAFLAAVGGPDIGDKYVDGHELAKRLKLELRP